jgi:hypothetical protein
MKTNTSLEVIGAALENLWFATVSILAVEHNGNVCICACSSSVASNHLSREKNLNNKIINKMKHGTTTTT